MNQARKQLYQRLFFGLVVLALILLPFYGGQYTVTTFIRIIYFGFLSLSMGFLIGQGGLVSLTQTAFFGLAGYAVALLMMDYKIIFPWPDLAAVGVVFLFSLFFGLIAMRTQKIVFMMITLAFGQIVWAFATQNTTLMHGWAGVRGIRPYVLFGVNFNITSTYYWAALTLFLLGLFILWRIVKSPFGLALNGIRENPRRMAALGYPVYWIKVVAFLIAAQYAALGGILATYNTGIMMPTTLALSRSIWVLLTVILGGSTFFWGPLVGTVTAIWLDVFISSATERYNLVIGTIFLLIVLFSPTGILGFLDSVRKGQKLKFIAKLFSPAKNNTE
jgi:branched-chain amino acid transport system permease protein